MSEIFFVVAGMVVSPFELFGYSILQIVKDEYRIVSMGGTMPAEMMALVFVEDTFLTYY